MRPGSESSKMQRVLRFCRDRPVACILGVIVSLLCAAAVVPATAAIGVTRLGARKAKEIVILTCRTLHRSRFAIFSALAFALARSSLSQRRPRAIDATKVARVSERIGRAWCGWTVAGTSTSRRRLDGVLAA